MSELKRYSVGIVVRDKLRTTDVIEVFPIEKMGNIDLDLNNIDELKSYVKEGNETDLLAANKSHILRAKWHPRGQTNRSTPPDVVRGETVDIYRYGNSDNYFWDTAWNDNDLRKTEHVMYVFSNTPNEKQELNIDNTYYITVSTKDKYVKIHTSDNDGELCTYDIELNTKKGFFQLLDGRKNFMLLDSSKDEFTGTIHKKVTWNTKDFNINCDTFTVNASKQTTLNTNISLIKAKSSHTEDTPKAFGMGTLSNTGIIHSDSDLTTNILTGGVNNHIHDESIGSSTAKPKNG